MSYIFVTCYSQNICRFDNTGSFGTFSNSRNLEIGLEFQSLLFLGSTDRNFCYKIVYDAVSSCLDWRVPIHLQHSVRKVRIYFDNWGYQYWNYLLIYWKFPIMLIHLSVNSGWLFNTRSRALRAD